MISGLSGKPPIFPVGQTGDLPREAAAVRPTASAPADDVQMKSLARDLASSPPVDSARVADLKARISAGLYSVEPERIADAMIRDLKG